MNLFSAKNADGSPRHPLTLVTVTAVKSFDDWLSAMDRPQSLEFLQGLIKCGFRASLGDRTHKDRVLCYLALADGWGEYSPKSFLYPSEEEFAKPIKLAIFEESFRSVSEIRKRLAREAFSELAYHYFRELEKEQVDKRWRWVSSLLSDEELLVRVLDFFRLEGRSLRNLGASPEFSSNKFARQFLFDLCMVHWNPGFWRDTFLTDFLTPLFLRSMNFACLILCMVWARLLGLFPHEVRLMKQEEKGSSPWQ